MSYRPRNSVEGPHQHQIELSAAGVGHHLIEDDPANPKYLLTDSHLGYRFIESV